MKTLRSVFKQFIDWFRTPREPHIEISDELHFERELWSWRVNSTPPK